jgi:phospholipid/cholesterol/gamma-HCH transport system ATP-binding protein
MPAMPALSSILKLSEVTIESCTQYEFGLSSVSFELKAGELWLVRIEREDERLPLADAAEGLVPPTQGSVTFLSEDWQRMSTDHAAAQRGRIGRLFEDEGWINDLDLDQNITLSQRHHTKRSEQEIMDEALKLACLFGLPGLPRGRPASVRRPDLRKAACIRAFLGQPALIILERPERGVYVDLIAPLINAVQLARRRGAAVLWTASDPRIWDNTALCATTRAKMIGSQLHVLEAEL